MIKQQGNWVIKSLVVLSFSLFPDDSLHAQPRVLSEAKLEYAISIKATITNKQQNADSIDGADLIVWMRGNQVRLDFNSKLRQQSTFYRGTEKSGVIIKFAGSEQFITELDPWQWSRYFYSTKLAKLDTLANEEEQNGYSCQKLLLTRNDSTQVTIYLTKQMLPLVKGYEPMFEQLDGIPVRYNYNVNGYLVEYQLKNIETIPISTSRFEVPQLTYKILEYPKENSIKKAYR